MIIAGEASGDTLAADLVRELQAVLPEVDRPRVNEPLPRVGPLAPEFFGTGGPQMAKAGVELLEDMTRFSAVGVWEVFRRIRTYRKVFRKLLQIALDRKPDVVIGVDFFGFNGRFARALRRLTRQKTVWFHGWSPLIVQYVSPQVWASRPSRAKLLAENHDLLISIIPFEKEWYSRNVPELKVEYVGHPIVDKLGIVSETSPGIVSDFLKRILLLPGSRVDEIRRHLGVMIEAVKLIRAQLQNVVVQIVFASEDHRREWEEIVRKAGIEIHPGPVLEALRYTDLAITKSGTVTLECAVMGVPAVVMYRTSWPTYFVARKVVNVRYLSMPNLIANEEVYPEFIQHRATPSNIARAAIDLLSDPKRYIRVKETLAKISTGLRTPGATRRAAMAICKLLE